LLKKQNLKKEEVGLQYGDDSVILHSRTISLSC